LVKRLTRLYAQREGKNEPPLTDEQIERFLLNALARAGAEEMVTPREIIRDYLTLLNILRDNKGATFDSLIKNSAASCSTVEEVGLQTATEEKRKVNIFDIDI
jgi:hypothetical protein